MAESTAYEALVAEMLADIGKLHDEVKSLKDYLPAQVETVELRLAGIIGLLQKAGDSYQEALKAYTQSQGDTIRLQMEKDAHSTRQNFQRDYNDLVNSALEKIENTVKGTLQVEITEPMRGVTSALVQCTWKTIVVCLCSGLVSGLIVYAGLTLTHDSNLEASSDLGRAVATAWPNLDKKAKVAIEAARVK